MTNQPQTVDVIGDVRDYISNTMLVGLSDQPIEADESLVQLGVVDSTGVLDLVEFLQQKFGITIDDTEITLENLDTLNAIGGFVHRKLSRGRSEDRRAAQQT